MIKTVEKKNSRELKMDSNKHTLADFIEMPGKDFKEKAKLFYEYIQDLG